MVQRALHEKLKKGELPMEYKEEILCDGEDETIKFTIVVPVIERLAELIERSAIEVFEAVYDYDSAAIVLKGSIIHTVV